MALEQSYMKLMIYDRHIRTARILYTTTVITVTFTIFVWLVVCGCYLDAFVLYVDLSLKEVPTVMPKLKEALYMYAEVCILYGLLQLIVPYSMYLMRKWSGISRFLLTLIILMFVVASVLLIYGGLAIMERLPEFEEKCMTAYEMSKRDPVGAEKFFKEARDEFSAGALRYTVWGFFVLFVGYIMAMWGLADFAGAKNICIGFLFISIGHLFLLLLLTILFGMLSSIIGYIQWLKGIGRVKNNVIKKYTRYIREELEMMKSLKH